MPADNPRISFTFPYRWLTDEEDRKYLSKNFTALAKKGELKIAMHPRLAEPFINSYSAVLKCHAFQPVKIKLTKKQLEESLKEVFGNAPCNYYEALFVQTTNRDSLPIMELEIYY